MNANTAEESPVVVRFRHTKNYFEGSLILLRCLHQFYVQRAYYRPQSSRVPELFTYVRFRMMRKYYRKRLRWQSAMKVNVNHGRTTTGKSSFLRNYILLQTPATNIQPSLWWLPEIRVVHAVLEFFDNFSMVDILIEIIKDRHPAHNPWTWRC